MTQQRPTEDYGLGDSPTAEYGISKNVPGVLVFLGIFFGLLGLGLVIGGLIASLSDSSLLCLTVAGVFPLGVAVWAFAQFFTRRSLRVLVFPEGLVHIRGGKAQVFRWDEIAKVYMSLQKTRVGGRAVQHSYRIQDVRGKRAEFTGDIPGVATLGQTIQQEVTRRMLPRALETYNAGGTVEFGSLSVSQQGLSNRRETVPWSDIEEVKVQRGIITVKKAGKWLNWANVTVGGTPNVFVFLALADRVIGVMH